MSKARIDKIEWTLERHDASIESAIVSLTSIKNTLVQIKWAAIGAFAIIVADQLGVTAFLRVLGI
jgi:hypothetical protein|tara:strand:+ start:1641 stop:1835 length:195 start_codon:yes stop_codon:yes gene_type:complete